MLLLYIYEKIPINTHPHLNKLKSFCSPSANATDAASAATAAKSLQMQAILVLTLGARL